jgi:ribosome maturation factor RimP
VERLTQRSDIAEKVTKVAEPMALSMGYELVQVVYRRESLGWTLRVLLDREDGINVEECRRFSRELSDVLDVEDLIPNAYRLEVSSPGLDRPLVKRDDFQRFSGRQVVVKTVREVEGRRKFEGVLVGLEDGRIVLESGGNKHALAFELVEKANLVPEIDGFPSSKGKR